MHLHPEHCNVQNQVIPNISDNTLCINLIFSLGKYKVKYTLSTTYDILGSALIDIEKSQKQ